MPEETRSRSLLNCPGLLKLNLLGSWTPILILDGVLLGVSIQNGEYIKTFWLFFASLADLLTAEFGVTVRLTAEFGVDALLPALLFGVVKGDALINLFRCLVDTFIFCRNEPKASRTDLTRRRVRLMTLFLSPKGNL